MTDEVLTEEQFDEYGPMVPSTGNEYWEHPETLAFPLERVWTITEGDGPWMNLYACAGFVNTVGYVITERPWVTGGETAYWYFDDRQGFVAQLEDSDEVEEVGEDIDDARQRIESTHGQKVVSIRPLERA